MGRHYESRRTAGRAGGHQSADRSPKSGPSARDIGWWRRLNRVVTRIEVFADIVCPFTHVGLRRLLEARPATGRRMSVRVRAWPLELVNGTPVAADLAAREIEALRAGVAPHL